MKNRNVHLKSVPRDEVTEASRVGTPMPSTWKSLNKPWKSGWPANRSWDGSALEYELCSRVGAVALRKNISPHIGPRIPLDNFNTGFIPEDGPRKPAWNPSVELGHNSMVIVGVIVPTEKLKHLRGLEEEHHGWKKVNHQSDRVTKPILKSINQYGFSIRHAIHLIIDPTGHTTVQDGNHRLGAAILLGLKYVLINLQYHQGSENIDGPFSFKTLEEERDSTLPYRHAPYWCDLGMWPTSSYRDLSITNMFNCMWVKWKKDKEPERYGLNGKDMGLTANKYT